MIDKLLTDIRQFADFDIEATLAESKKKCGEKSHAYVVGVLAAKLSAIVLSITAFETTEPFRRLLEDANK